MPDFELFGDPALVQARVDKNRTLVQKLTDSPRSERQRVLDLGLTENDFAARLAAFATRCGLEEPKSWTRRIVVERENWGLSFGNWRLDERRRAIVSIEVHELGLPSAGDNPQHLKDYPALAAMAGQPYLLTGEKGVRDITARFTVQPEPRTVEGLEKFRVELVSENGGPIGRIVHVGKGKAARAEYKATLSRLNRIDWEEGWHYIRVVPLDTDGEPLDVAPGAYDLHGGESERFYVVPEAETEEPPERSAGRYPGLTQALRTLQLDALAAGEDPTRVTAINIRWKAPGARSPHRTLSAKIHAAGNGEIRLSALLVQAQQHLLAHPDDTSLRRMLLHSDGTADVSNGDDTDLRHILTGRAVEAYDAFATARRAYFAAITGEDGDFSAPAGLLVSEAVDFEQVRDDSPRMPRHTQRWSMHRHSRSKGPSTPLGAAPWRHSPASSRSTAWRRRSLTAWANATRFCSSRPPTRCAHYGWPPGRRSAWTGQTALAPGTRGPSFRYETHCWLPWHRSASRLPSRVRMDA